MYLSPNKKGCFFLGFIGSEYDKHDCTRNQPQPLPENVRRRRIYQFHDRKTRSLAWMQQQFHCRRPCLQGGRVTLALTYFFLPQQEGYHTCLVNAQLGITCLPGTTFRRHV